MKSAKISFGPDIPIYAIIGGLHLSGSVNEGKVVMQKQFPKNLIIEQLFPLIDIHNHAIYYYHILSLE